MTILRALATTALATATFALAATVGLSTDTITVDQTLDGTPANSRLTEADRLTAEHACWRLGESGHENTIPGHAVVVRHDGSTAYVGGQEGSDALDQVVGSERRHFEAVRAVCV